jgi:diguanylate cyclase
MHFVLFKQGLRFWKDSGLARLGMVLSTNVSGKQFAQQGFFSRLQSIIQKSDVPPRLIQLEVTETALMHNVEETVAKLDFLQKLGVRISINDFGTGYSSLEYLRRFNADSPKIDMSFVQQLGKDEKTSEVVRAMINLAEIFNMGVVGEGIETENQKLLLQDLGCLFTRGTFIPVP